MVVQVYNEQLSLRAPPIKNDSKSSLLEESKEASEKAEELSYSENANENADEQSWPSMNLQETPSMIQL